MWRTGIGTFRGGRQIGNPGIYIGIEDKVAKHQQETLQDFTFLNDRQLRELLNAPESFVANFVNCETHNSVTLSIHLFFSSLRLAL
jgi:hypothetical protein